MQDPERPPQQKDKFGSIIAEGFVAQLSRKADTKREMDPVIPDVQVWWRDLILMWYVLVECS